MTTWTVKNWMAFVVALVLAAVAGTFGVPSAHAQYREQYPSPNAQGPYAPPPNAQAPNPNAPGPAETDAGAARVSFIRGDVGMQRGDSGESSAATLNTPLVAGDKISTGDTSRAEVQLDYANILRLDANAQANIAALSRAVIQIQLAQGLANYSLLKGSDANAEIDTPNVAIHPSRDGRYRILVTPDGETDVVVREGEADISTQQGSVKVHKGELITVIGAGNDTQYKVTRASAADDWDNWNRDRDDIILHARGRERTNPYYTGTQDLDPYGVWSEVPDYGNVWVPNVAADWAPYRTGRWVWEPLYGWTWVSYEPWGWAPYHYGRWFLYGSRWAWWPGPVYGGYRPVWAPAYVSFFGFGGVGVGFGLGFGSIGWLPIGPGDYFHPWWGGYRERFGAVAVGSFNLRDGIAPLHAGGGFSNLHDMNVNDRMRAGISSVPSGNFGHGVVVARGVSASDLRGARMMTGNVPVAPSRDSLHVSDRQAGPSTFSGRAVSQQRFFSNRPVAAAPQSFGEQSARIQQSIQQSGRFQSSAGRQAFEQQGSQSSQGFQRSSPPSSAGARPPLDMSKPIVNQRSGGYAGAPAYRGAPPSYRPSPSAPSYRGGSSAGGGSRGGSGRSGGSHR